MGAEAFDHYGDGTDIQAAYDAAVAEAQYNYGHSGYTGTIAEKDGFEMRNGGKPLTFDEAQAFADNDLDVNHDEHDKWGPAWVVPINEYKDGPVVGFLFYGYASS